MSDGGPQHHVTTSLHRKDCAMSRRLSCRGTVTHQHCKNMPLSKIVCSNDDYTIMCRHYRRFLIGLVSCLQPKLVQPFVCSSQHSQVPARLAMRTAGQHASSRKQRLSCPRMVGHMVMALEFIWRVQAGQGPRLVPSPALPLQLLTGLPVARVCCQLVARSVRAHPHLHSHTASQHSFLPHTCPLRTLQPRRMSRAWMS